MCSVLCGQATWRHECCCVPSCRSLASLHVGRSLAHSLAKELVRRGLRLSLWSGGCAVQRSSKRAGSGVSFWLVVRTDGSVACTQVVVGHCWGPAALHWAIWAPLPQSVRWPVHARMRLGCFGTKQQLVSFPICEICLLHLLAATRARGRSREPGFPGSVCYSRRDSTV